MPHLAGRLIMKRMDLGEFDPQVNELIGLEKQRQHQHLELIASENYASAAVRAAQASILTNKYAEGYPGKRYYGGCEQVDKLERLACERAKELFNCDYANVQPHSGSQANAAVFMALLEPGDTVMSLSLTDGGHLTHGAPVNFSGHFYHFVHYGLDKDSHLIDYDGLAALAKEHQPKLIIAGYSAYSRTIDWQKFRQVADSCGAYLLVDMAHIAGLVAAGFYQSPLPYADAVTTTTHKTLRGPRGGMILSNQAARLGKKLNSGIFPGNQGGPLMHVIAAKAVALKEAMDPAFKIYQQQVISNAATMADRFMSNGFEVISSGTDTHLVSVSLLDKDITGKDAESWLDGAGITLNKNTIPNDPRSPFVTSGLRLGTAAVTTRGMKDEQLVQITDWITALLDQLHDSALQTEIRQSVFDLCDRFPVF